MSKTKIVEVPQTEPSKKMTIGQEVMRSAFGNEKTRKLKEEFAALFDKITQEAMDADNRANKGPMIDDHHAIQAHMVVVAAAQETMRCMSEACKYLELACMYAVKGITA
ncbi:MAG: hypothetical protein E6R03_17730 [Hyphomicrobiaceae bacterium]|nr:MAG: hypothetical protein E6R03_17730 [Hyphomicrobiaceae bacterium]